MLLKRQTRRLEAVQHLEEFYRAKGFFAAADMAWLISLNRDPEELLRHLEGLPKVAWATVQRLKSPVRPTKQPHKGSLTDKAKRGSRSAS